MVRALGGTAAAVAFVAAMLAGSIPARAALSGYHAGYFSESAFLSLAPGQTGQFAVGYTNIGDRGWVKGAPLQSASLHTAAPIDNVVDFNAGWALSWLSADQYAAQSSDLVAPSQVGYFIYQVKVPTSAATGPHTFYGRPFIDGVGPMEDFGYFQIATVTAATIVISGTSPASPSSNQTPTVSGSGAPPGASVSIQDGIAVVGTGTAQSDGSFSITTSALSSGSHTLIATASNGTSGGFTYVVDRTPPAVLSASASNVGTVLVSFSEPVKCPLDGSASSAGTGANYSIKTSPSGSAIAETIAPAPNADCTQVSLALSVLLSNNQQYTVTVANVQDRAGNAIGGGATAVFTVSDTTPPTASSAAYTTPTTIRIGFSEPMDLSTIGNKASYNVDGVSCATACGSAAISTTFTSATLTLGATPSTGTHSVDIFNVRDASGNVISPSPTSFTLAYPPTATRPFVSGASAVIATVVNVTFNVAMDPTTAQQSSSYAIARADGTAYSTTISAACSPNATSCATVTLTVGTALSTGKTYNVTVSGVTDKFGNAIGPNPTVFTFTYTADTQAPSVLAGSATQTTLSVSYSEAMRASNPCGSTGTPGAGPDGNIDSRDNYTSSNGALQSAISSATAVTLNGSCGSVTFNLGSVVPAGTYGLSIGTGPPATTPQDLAGNALGISPWTLTVTITDTTPPQLVSVSSSGAVITAQFSESMTTSGANSVTQNANWRLDDATLPAGTTISCTTTSCQTVTLTLPAALTAGSNHTLRALGVTDTAGNALDPATATKGFTAT